MGIAAGKRRVGFSLDLFDSTTAARQLRYADIVLLNKCDLVGPDTVAAIEETIHAIGERAHIVRTTEARGPLPLLQRPPGSSSSTQSRIPAPDAIGWC